MTRLGLLFILHGGARAGQEPEGGDRAGEEVIGGTTSKIGWKSFVRHYQISIEWVEKRIRKARPGYGGYGYRPALQANGESY
jgi:hypothetical protein